MEININNYESILIDYFDGKLNALEVAEVLLFLEQHPEIKREFEAIGNLPEAPQMSIDSSFKSQLKKLNNQPVLAEKSFNELIIAQMEGDCNEKEAAAINELINGNKSLLRLKEIFQLTILKPDLQITFPNKKALKRKEAVVFYLTRRFAAAAALLLLASLIFLVYRNANKNIDAVQLAQIKNEVSPKNTIPANNKIEDSIKNIETPTTGKVAAQNENKIKQNNAVFSTSNSVKSLVAEAAPVKRNVEVFSMPVKTPSTIENNIALNNSLQGTVIPVDIIAFNASENKNDFLTIGDWMKKKLIERGKNNLIENEKPAENENIALEPITIASLGAGLVEKTTGKKVFLSRSYDKAGSLKSYAFAAGNFKFERIK